MCILYIIKTSLPSRSLHYHCLAATHTPGRSPRPAPPARPGACWSSLCAQQRERRGEVSVLCMGLSPPSPSSALPPSSLQLRDQTRPTMGFMGLSSAVLLLCLVTLAGPCSARSDAPRGVALGFVFDPKATCDPPCEHAGICIRNNTCFCSRGYEGETCQYGDVTLFFLSMFMFMFE